jgi:hypothetical protein
LELARLKPGLWQSQDPTQEFIGSIRIPVMAMEVHAQGFRVWEPEPALIELALETLFHRNAEGRVREVRRFLHTFNLTSVCIPTVGTA